jgi:hypothetical protein
MNQLTLEANSLNPHPDGASLRITREELYEKVWSQPMVKVAKEFGISDRGLATALSACRFTRHHPPQQHQDLLHRAPAFRDSQGPSSQLC